MDINFKLHKTAIVVENKIGRLSYIIKFENDRHFLNLLSNLYGLRASPMVRKTYLHNKFEQNQINIATSRMLRSITVSCKL